jgi:hypothetical protein
VSGSHEQPDFFHLDLSYLHKTKRINYTSYHHYSPVSSGGLQAIEEGTYDTSKSEAACTRVQRATALSSIRSALCPDPSTSRSVFNSGKCDTVVTNAEPDPQWTLLAEVASIQSSSSSITVDIDTAKEDVHQRHPTPDPQLTQLRPAEPLALHPPHTMQLAPP